MKKISALSTTCKDCLFAKYDGITQTDCHLGKIDKIKNHPVYELVEAMDDDKEFYVLNYHLCLHQRVKGWEHDNEPMEDMINLVRDEIKMKWGAILILKDEKQQDMSRVEERLGEILNQSEKPSWVGIINDDVDLDVYWIIDYLNKQDIPWSIQSSGDSIYSTIDTIVQNFKNQKFLFYATFDSDKVIEPDFYDKIYDSVINELKQYSVISDEGSMHRMVVNKVAHFKYAGNGVETSLLDRIKQQATEHTLLVNYKDLQ